MDYDVGGGRGPHFLGLSVYFPACCRLPWQLNRLRFFSGHPCLFRWKVIGPLEVYRSLAVKQLGAQDDLLAVAWLCDHVQPAIHHPFIQ